MTGNSSDPLSGRIALVTGANTGIGLVTARELVRRGARVFIACRTPARAEHAVETIRAVTGQTVDVLPLDLGDLASVRTCAEHFLSRNLPLHLLINNAGLAGQRGLTRSGFELAFGTNHIGHFLLTKLLLERMQRSAPARIVNVASKAHYRAKGLDWDALRKPTRSLSALSEYQTSKLANVLFSAELARRLAGTGITTYSLHPGVIASEVWRSVPWPVRSVIKLGMISTEEGAKTTLHCATSPEAAQQTGLYYDESKVREPSKVAQNRELATELWERSEAWTA